MEQRRTRHACARCRRQKLKCDTRRPCPLCVHAHAECTDATERTRRTNRTSLQDASHRHGPRMTGASSPDVTVSSPNRIPSNTTTDSSDTSTHAHGPLFHTSPSPGRFDHVDRPEDRSSALNLAEKIFSSHRHVRTSRNRLVDAIPDGIPSDTVSPPANSNPVPVVELIGMELPPTDVANALLTSYIDSMHWYLMIFHEATVRSHLEPILATGMALPSQRPFLVLVLMLLSIGARFMNSQDVAQLNLSVDICGLKAQMLGVAERWFLPCLEEPTVESVAFSFLLSCNYLFNRQPRSALITMETTVRAAQSMGLHQESTWRPNIHRVEREVRRRVWWTVFVGAGFVAMSYGKPSQVIGTDCQTRQPVGLDDDSASCPGFDSQEQLEDGETCPVTIQSYHRFKARLYTIATPIIQEVYFNRSRKPSHLIRRVKEFHELLLAWEKTVPPELRLETYSGCDFDAGDSRLLRIFAVQAMTLQISYDNVQLFLFRPLISRARPSQALPENGRLEEPVPQLNAAYKSDLEKLITIGRKQCLTSAMRTSNIIQHLDVLRLVKGSPACVHMGVHAFSAGVMLGLLFFGDPLSVNGQACKRGIARLIRVPSAAGFDTPVWTQATQVLTDLMHVIASEETQALISRDGEGPTPAEGGLQFPAFGAPPDQYSVPTDENSGSNPPPTSVTVGRQFNSNASSMGTATWQPNPEGFMSIPETNIPCQSEPGIPDGLSGIGSSGQGSEPDMFSSGFSSYTDGIGQGVPGLGQTWMWDDSFSYLGRIFSSDSV